MGATKKGTWVTNIPKGGLRAQYPRRLAKYKLGEPFATISFSTEELEELGLEGMYLDEDVPEGLKSRPMVTYGDKIL